MYQNFNNYSMPRNTNYNPNSFNTQQYRTPFSIPRSNAYINPIVGNSTSKFNITKFLSGAENMIATANQVIPLYQQIKPLWDNTKVIRDKIKIFSPFKTNQNNSQSQNNIKETIINPEVITPEQHQNKTEKKKENNNYRNYEQKEPNKPFF